MNPSAAFVADKHSSLLLCLLFIVPILGLAACDRSHAAIKLPDTEVLVASPLQQDVPVHSEWVATLDGYVNAEIRPQVSGYIISQDYKEGSVVRKGQVLFEIDPRPFQAALDRAKGELAQAQAQLGKSTIDVERDTPLAAQKAVSKEKLDTEIQAKLAAEAEVESAKAAVERAELDLGWTKVTSLVDGVAGIAEVQMGNLVGPNSHLTSVSQVDPIKVYFPVSEQEYLRAKHLSSNGQPMDLFDSPPELILADGTVYPHKGRNPADRSPGGHEHRHYPRGSCIPQSRQYSASGPVWACADPDQLQQERTAGAAKRGQGNSGRLRSRPSRQRQQSDYSSRQGRREDRDDVGD